MNRLQSARTILLDCLALILILPSVASGQCLPLGDEYWTGNAPRPYPTGADATCIWNGVLMVADQGEIYAWSGTQWLPLGAGLDSNVHHMIEHGGDLVVAGDFTTAAGQAVNHIVRYDGSWHPMGGGMDDVVDMLAIFGNELIALGEFTTAGGVAAQQMAAWDGSVWAPLAGEIFLGEGWNDAVEYDGQLVIAGEFGIPDETNLEEIVAWNGATWSSLAGGPDGPVYALAVHDGRLIAAGEFTAAGGVPAQGVAAWDGSAWSALGSGVDLSFPRAGVVAGGLHVSSEGDYGLGNGTVYRWNGLDWVDLFAGAGTLSGVVALEDLQGELIIALSSSYGRESSVFRRDGTDLFPLRGAGLNGSVLATRMWNGSLVIAGAFTQVGAVTAHGIARWDGAAWHALGTGLPPELLGDQASNWIETLTVHEGDLVVGGRFDEIGGIAARNIVRWDGSAWSPIGDGLGLSGAPERVRAVESSQGTLVAGGNFTRSGTNFVDAIAIWYEGAWLQYFETYQTEVRDLVAYGDGGVIAGSNVGVYGNGILFVDAEGFSVLGTGGPAASSEVAVFDGKLIATGPQDVVMQWDGEEWTTLAGPPVLSRQIHDLVEHGGRLYVVGDFEDFAGSGAHGAVAWYGACWRALGSGVDAPYGASVQAVASTPWGLVLGGDFSEAGGQPYFNLAYWTVPDLPTDASPTASSDLRLRPNVPNPFNPSTLVRFTVPAAGHGSLRIYDRRGSLVRILARGQFAAGPGEVRWDGTDDAGRAVASGVYCARLEVGGQAVSRSLVLVR